MDKVYLAIKDRQQGIFGEQGQVSQIFTDELSLARYIREQWDCYIFEGLKKVESVETTVIEAK